MTWFALVLYAAAAIGLGWLARSKAESGAAFWTAGRSLGSLSVGLSISAGFMSVSWSCVYAVQLYYWYGLGAIWLITIPWVITLAGIWMLTRRYHSLAEFSQPEMVGRRFGDPARKVVALALAFVFVVWGGAEIYIAATLLAPGLGVSIPVIIVGISIVVAIYSTMGGFSAVVSTDRMQYALVAIYVVAMGWLAFRGMSSDGSRLFPDARVMTFKSGGSWTEVLSPGIPLVAMTLLAYLPGWLFETDLWLRVQGARDDRSARRGVVIAIINALLFVGVFPMFIGIAALELFPHSGGVSPGIVGNEGDAIFAALVTTYAPEWLAGLVALGLIAAAMSTIDTCANVVGLSMAYDMLRVHEKENGDRASRILTVVSMAMLCIFALNTESLWDIFYLSGGILTTAVAFPVAAVFISGASARGVTASSAFGLIGTVTAYFLGKAGWLAAIEPSWLSGTGLGYVVWGIVAAVCGYFLGVRH